MCIYHLEIYFKKNIRYNVVKGYIYNREDLREIELQLLLQVGESDEILHVIKDSPADHSEAFELDESSNFDFERYVRGEMRVGVRKV